MTRLDGPTPSAGCGRPSARAGQDRPASVAGVRLAWLDLDPGREVEAGLTAQLHSDEAVRVGRLRTPIDRRRATVRLVRRREIIAAEIGVGVSDVVIGTEPGGRPYVRQPHRPDLRLSTSSSGDVGVVAVACEVELGVDLQVSSEMPDGDDVISWIAHPAEVRYLRSLPLTSRRRAVAEMWTAKEAYLKATGDGLGGDMRTVRLPVAAARRGLRPGARQYGPLWRLYHLCAPAVGMTAALAVGVRPGVSSRRRDAFL